MKTIIVSSSKSSHGNTRRVAEVFAGVLNARVVTPGELTPPLVAGVDRIGFGSGIYWMGFDQRLIDCIEALPDMDGREAFVFATSGMPEPPFRRYTRNLEHTLRGRGFRVTGTFTCRGVDTWGPFKMVGGTSKGHPSANDLARAHTFASTISG